MTRPASSGPILIIEDERNIASLVEGYLARAGFATLTASDGQTGLDMARQRAPRLVILDLMLPGMDGWEVCRELRRASDVPILILTAQEEEMDRILGFSLGADDYVVKPFSPRELVERVKAILRRARDGRPAPSAALRRGDLSLDPERHRVTRGGEAVALTPTEFRILHALMAAPGRVFTREELLARLYSPAESVVDRVIDVHIGKLRQKIEPDPARPSLILTVRGVGYSFSEAGER